jgi:hypothetical protein
MVLITHASWGHSHYAYSRLGASKSALDILYYAYNPAMGAILLITTVDVRRSFPETITFPSLDSQNAAITLL